MSEQLTKWTSSLSWGSPAWFLPMGILAVLIGVMVIAWYCQRGMPTSARVVAAMLKLVAIGALAVCVLEPLFHGIRPRPGANLFAVAVDNSRSLGVTDGSGQASRAEQLRKHLEDDAPWLSRLGQDFELRRFLMDTRLKATDSFHSLTFSGNGSALRGALTNLASQFRGRPIAGVLVLSDGNATDWNESEMDWSGLPPIYPVVIGSDQSNSDLAVSRVTVSQTNFETTPVTVMAEISGQQLPSEAVVVQLLDREGKEVQRHVGTLSNQGTLTHRFQFRPEQPGVSFFQVRTFLASEEATASEGKSPREATTANNSRLVMVDRGRGPYRVLYVAGRPNWEFKFLRRAVAEDDEIELVGLVRIAKREPKFSFRSRSGETTNPLFRGFGNQTDETAEQYDEPVLVRFGTRDQAELRDGFPKTAEQLFEYHAVVLDDVEAEFFTQDQMSLLHRFVSHRGGSLLMLGGQESFASGNFARTPLGELLPVYFEKTKAALPEGDYRWSLARDGWLQPWVRLRATETEEQRRLAEMPTFRTVNHATGLKPGATVLASLMTTSDPAAAAGAPALVVQPFGQGRTAALLIGDLWRWGMRRTSPTNSDFDQAWRQTVRWLVADVPRRVELRGQRGADPLLPSRQLTLEVRDAAAEPLDNAEIKLSVLTPDGKQVAVDAIPSEHVPGEYETTFMPRVSGGYLARATVSGPDGAAIGDAEVGFTHEPEGDEFRSLNPNRELLARIAERTGGEMIELDELEDFVASLPNRRVPVTEPWIYPIWHHWGFLMLAISCLAGEWGLRRWKGWP